MAKKNQEKVGEKTSQAKEAKKDSYSKQPVINIGLVGHVDHGKTTLTEALSGKWTDVHSEEIKRGITIRLGYANSTFYKCPKCKDPESYGISKKCAACGSECGELRKISLVDAPGHESLMATMLSGSAIIDCALLLVAANEECPQPQTKEHLMALGIIGINKIIIVQNKIDLVSEEDVKKNYNKIKEFVKGTIAENAPIIPISAQHRANIDVLIKTIEEYFPTPQRDVTKDPLMFVARSFDVNKPGTGIHALVGGVLGGALKHGILNVGDEIEIRPGKKVEKEGKVFWESLKTKIIGLKSGTENIDKALPGGSIGVLTELDPSFVKSDQLGGNIVGLPDKLPMIRKEMDLIPHLLERVVGTKKELEVEPIKKGESLMLNVHSSVTVGIVTSLAKDTLHVVLKIPLCAEKTDRITISRMLGNRFRLIGYCNVKE
ncbi:translation initiation factor IF-2 subunit gamma [Candidatus Woesearchaeota archaeon]|nr:translation initiation factor IF-2 subunit gamma [Candidatus Woesearchaeota archaeon]